jgi:hypothetical protein
VSEKRLRVVRTLEFIGPESWIRTTLDLSWVAPDRPVTLTPDKGPATVREIGRTEEEVE